MIKNREGRFSQHCFLNRTFSSEKL